MYFFFLIFPFYRSYHQFCYIIGYVGFLTEEEQTTLATLKTELQARNISWETDYELCRFLRARKFVLKDALEMFVNFSNWYKENNIARFPNEFPVKAQALGELVPSAYFGFDREGHPVQIERTGKIDVPTLLSAVDDNSILLGWIWGQQLQIRRCDESAARLGVPQGSLERFTQLMDMEGLSSTHRQMTKFIGPIAQCGSDYFPNRLAKTIIFNPPWIFMVLWNIYKLLLDPATREKFIVCNTFEQLHEHIAPDQLPKRYGGTHEDPESLKDRDIEALRAKYLNDEKYKDKYEIVDVPAGSRLVKTYEIQPGEQYNFCFRANEDITFKAYFFPEGTELPSGPDDPRLEEKEKAAVQVSNEAVVESSKWPILGCFTPNTQKPGTLVLTWINANWWGGKCLRYVVLKEEVTHQVAPHEDADAIEGTELTDAPDA